MTDKDLLISVEDGIMTITLNRPERKNAFTHDMIEEWAAAYQSARTDDNVKVIVVTGAGDAFCAGGDVKAMGSADRKTESAIERKNRLHTHIHRIPLALEDLDKPVIAALNGVAVGAGLDMALMCDIRLAASTARFSEGYIKVGLVPGDGGSYFLPRLVGTAKALEMLWTGDFVTAEEALRLGLVNHVYPPEQLMEETYKLARRLAGGPTVTLGLIKRAVYQSARMELRAALDMISSHMAVVRDTEDHHEAVAAFREKRKPEFKGR